VVKWQKILRLQDWTVAIKWGRSFDLPHGKEATTRSSLSAKLAAVRILDPADYDPDSMAPQDIENTVVHELLHLHTWPFDHALADSLEARCVEQAIEAIATALVGLDRKANP
jgi:hypothetical protein